MTWDGARGADSSGGWDRISFVDASAPEAFCSMFCRFPFPFLFYVDAMDISPPFFFAVVYSPQPLVATSCRHFDDNCFT